MYKLFIMLKYLRSRVLAYFAVLVVMLCVAMMLIAVSVMTGFLQKIESAAKGLFGEVIVDSYGHQGIAHYDAFMAVLAGGPYPVRSALAVTGRDGQGPAVFANPSAFAGDAWALGRHDPNAPALTVPARGRLVGDDANWPLTGRLTVRRSNPAGPSLTFTPDPTAWPADANGPLHLTDVQARLPGAAEGVQAATPFILTYGMMRVPEWPDYRQAVQIIGIRLPERARVTRFADGLFVQDNWQKPTFAPGTEASLAALAADRERMAGILERDMQAAEAYPPAKLPAELERQLLYLRRALRYNEDGAERIAHARRDAERFEALRDELAEAVEAGDDPAEMRIRREARLLDLSRYQSGPDGTILGAGVAGVTTRTDRGEVIRILTPGRKVLLDIFPLGDRLSETDFEPARGAFSVVDHVRSGVASIDSEVVYLDFDRLQVLNNMTAPPRTSQIHIKVAEGISGERALREVAGRVRRIWSEFHRRFPDAAVAGSDVTVQTWRQRQEAVVGPIEAQRVLVAIMFGVISTTAVVVIFVLFYSIIVQKTRDIGILKAVGASATGVAAIFLSYGAVIGLIGGALGSLLGFLVVHYINPIHDWVAGQYGLVIWDRRHFMFDRIPNEIYAGDLYGILIGAVLAGVLGAGLPSALAAWRNPVEALRYE